MPADSPLVSIEDLHRAGERVTLIDVRWWLGGPPGRDAYLAGHLPGAVFADLETNFAGPPDPAAGGRHPLPSPDALEATARALGVRGDVPVVVYDAGDGWPASRAWWCLTWAGHPDVRVLDGGYESWVGAGLPVTAEVPDVAPGDFTAAPGQLPLLDAAGAAALARDGVLLDARAGERYRGETEPIDRVAGHVPGAVSAPTTANRGPDGRLLSPGDLRERFAALGADGSRPVGAYCGSGISAAYEVLALRVAGVEAALYAGSWSDWTSDRERPVATGPEPG